MKTLGTTTTYEDGVERGHALSAHAVPSELSMLEVDAVLDCLLGSELAAVAS